MPRGRSGLALGGRDVPGCGHMPARLVRLPGLAGFGFDELPHQAAQHLRSRDIVLGAEPFEDGFLARIDQDGKTGGSFFDGHGRP